MDLTKASPQDLIDALKERFDTLIVAGATYVVDEEDGEDGPLCQQIVYSCEGSETTCIGLMERVKFLMMQED